MPIRTTIQKHRVQWILNALEHLKPESLASRRLVSWIASNHDRLGVALPKGFTVEESPKKKGAALPILPIDESQEDAPTKQKRSERYATIRDVLKRNLSAAKKSKTLTESDVEKNLRLLADRIKLSAEDREALLFYIDLRANRFDLALANIREGGLSGDDYFEKASWFLSVTEEELKARLSQRSVLRNFVSYTPESRNYGEKHIDFTADDAYVADRRFVSALSEPSSSADSIISRLLGPTPTTELTLEDFAYVGKEELNNFVEIMRGFVEGNGIKRKNGSFYGDPGVGKTELTAVIAKHLGVPLFSIGLSHLDDDNALSENIKEPSRQDRLQAWRRAAFLVNAANIKCIFLFDEADDILRDPNEDKNSNRASKGYLNWALQNNNIPTIFVTNNIERLERSTVRRILPTLEVTNAPREVQTKILLDYAKQYELSITQSQADKLTRDHRWMSSAVIETVLYNASRRADIKGKSDAQFKALQIGFVDAGAALNRGASPVPPIQVDIKGFDPELVRSQLDIPSLAKDFKSAESYTGLSLCLYGPNGSGRKTAFQYVAQQMGMDTMFLNFSSLYGMDGFSSEALSHVLKRAVSEKAFLVFHDASRLLSGQEWAKLDSHPFFRAIAEHKFPVGVTLHEADLLDDITPKQFWRLTSQFTFASRLGALVADGQKVALEKIVGLQPKAVDDVMAGIGGASSLVVGDFVRVAAQMKFRPSMANNPDAVLSALNYNAAQAGHPSLGSPVII